MLPYYVLKKTEEDRLFFHSHKGFYNFFDEYLILNLGYNNHLVLVNRLKRKFHGEYVKEEASGFREVINKHIESHSPEEMFRDFPEINKYTKYNYIIKGGLKNEV